MRGREHPADKAHRLYVEGVAKEMHERSLDDQHRLADWERELLFYGRKWYVQHGMLLVGPYDNQARAERHAENGGVPVALTEVIVSHMGAWSGFKFKEPV